MLYLTDKPRIVANSPKVLDLLDCLANTVAYGAEDAYVIKHSMDLLACIFPVSTKNAEVTLHHHRYSNGCKLYSLDCADSQIGAMYSRLLTQINHYVMNTQNISEFIHNSTDLVQSDDQYAPVLKEYQKTLGELRIEIKAQYAEEGDEEGFVHLCSMSEFE